MLMCRFLFAFELVEPGRVWLLAASSDAERNTWLRAISACVPPSLLHTATFAKKKRKGGGWNDRFFVLDPVAQSATYYGAEGQACDVLCAQQGGLCVEHSWPESAADLIAGGAVALSSGISPWRS